MGSPWPSARQMRAVPSPDAVTTCSRTVGAPCGLVDGALVPPQKRWGRGPRGRSRDARPCRAWRRFSGLLGGRPALVAAGVTEVARTDSAARSIRVAAAPASLTGRRAPRATRKSLAQARAAAHRSALCSDSSALLRGRRRRRGPPQRPPRRATRLITATSSASSLCALLALLAARPCAAPPGDQARSPAASRSTSDTAVRMICTPASTEQ